ncbi:MAG: hypothetical protein MI922_19080, partial [Bacteroidales bacterium]|nr:hypothetical protein [Bacteroidales bacterium]
MRWRITYIIIRLCLCYPVIGQNFDTIYLHPDQTNKNISYSFYYTVDTNQSCTADSIFNYPDNFSFISSKHKALNFDFSPYTVWLKGVFKNNCDTSSTYILSVENADIDYLSFYYLDADSNIQKTVTGELMPFQNRDVFHRIFLQKIGFKPYETKEILISAFNSHNILYLPTVVHGESGFNMRNLLVEFLNWFIIASLLFISLFNFYLWKTIKSKLSLYSAIFIFMAVIFVGFYDGYHFILNIPPHLSWVKWFSPCLFTIFLLLFTKTFTRENYSKNYPIKVINIFIILVILFTLTSPFPYPYMLTTYYAFPIIIGMCLVVMVFLSVTTTRYNYPPSILTLCGHTILLLGIIIHQLKEANALPSNVYTN